MNISRVLPLLLCLTAAAPSARAADKSGIDKSFLDKKTDPCVDFYQYACGGWLAHNPIPGDQSRWGQFNVLTEQNRAILKDILEKDKGKIGDYYASCMDEKAVEAKGAGALKPELDGIAALKSKEDLPPLLAHLHSIGASPFFEFGSDQDYEHAENVIAAFDQGGLSLPDRDYYSEEKFASQRKAFALHLKTMFALAGDAPDAADKEAQTVMGIETALAKASMSRVDRREPVNVHHKTELKAFIDGAPSFGWQGYLAAAGAPGFEKFDLVSPGFFAGLEAQLKDLPLDSLKSYLRWKVIHGLSPVLPKAFVDADFEFFGKTLAGQKELKARWKRCVAQVDRGLGEELGKAYVAREFGAGAKEKTLALVHEIEASMKEDLDSLPWMTPATKAEAFKKLALVTDKIGFPDKWRDYSALEVVKGDALGNYERASLFETRRDLAKIGKPVDKKEWGMTPPTVNAYYNPQMNNINFPAGILRPPFFSARADQAASYGAIGVVVGHELSHGFDDEGRHYDGEGNLKEWWTPEDDKAFQSRAQCLIDEYSGFSPVKDVKLNGKLTLGENTADNGGLRLSYMSFERMQSQHPRETLGGYTPEQRFFVGWGQAWCTNITDQAAKMNAVTDPHSPGKFRVNGTVSNMPEFAKAFACKADAPMVRKDACRVW